MACQGWAAGPFAAQVPCCGFFFFNSLGHWRLWVPPKEHSLGPVPWQTNCAPCYHLALWGPFIQAQQMSPLWVCPEPLGWEKPSQSGGRPSSHLKCRSRGNAIGKLVDWLTMENEAVVWCGSVLCWWPQQIPQGCGDFLRGDSGPPHHLRDSFSFRNCAHSVFSGLCYVHLLL